MIFTRTLSGISNFGKFVGADILIYTEGKLCSSHDEHIFDELFYKALISSFYPDKRIKVKCVGSKVDALEYASKLGDLVGGSVVIVDRDSEDLLCSHIPKKSIIYTDGYSWESDFWTSQLALEVLEDLACSSKHFAHLYTQIHFAKKRLAVLSVLDVCLHLNKEALLQKNGGGCGIGFNFSSLHVLPHKEVHRIFKKYRSSKASSCSFCTSILPIAILARSDRIIQGHIWEHVILNLINFGIAGLQKTKVPHQVVKNLAMSKFKKNPSGYLAQHSLEYYRRELKLRFG